MKNEITFIVEEAVEGGFTAHALGEGIVTEADTLAELHEMIRDAVDCHFEPSEKPKILPSCGNLNAILKLVADHFHATKNEVLERLKQAFSNASSPALHGSSASVHTELGFKKIYSPPAPAGGPLLDPIRERESRRDLKSLRTYHWTIGSPPPRG